ncbi:MAG: hypothetical protein PHX43_02695 [Alphaproteobacteria bacterium]|nr:hypothetical protein [Alphaproteobacteria bacterium]
MEKSDNAETKSGSRKIGLPSILITLIIVAIGATSVLAWKNIRNLYEARELEGIAIAQQTRDPAAERKIAAMESRIDELSLRLAKVEQQPASQAAPTKGQAAAAASNIDDINLLKSEVVALTTTVTNLENMLKQTANTANSGQKQALAALINSLKVVADTGKNFKPEFDFLRQAVINIYPDLSDSLAKVDPASSTGVKSIATLQEEFESLAVKAEIAINKAGANTWWQRALVEAKGLVTIRALHPKGGDMGIMAAISSDLSRHDLSAALKKVNGLPEAAQTTLKEWSAAAEARMALDTTLDKISERLSDAGKTHE